MGSRKVVPSVAFFLVFVLIHYRILAEAKYIEITANHVNIRVGAGESYPIVSKARKGDVFELHGKEGKWYKIRMFSLNWRYVHRSLAETTSYVVSMPDQVATRREIFRAFLRAEDRSEIKADADYPLEARNGRPISGNLRKNIDYMGLLNDRYLLEVAHKFKVQPPIYMAIIREGIRKNW